MIIEGEKYACDACVRGHRVSNCQHKERPLQHINKKGRPVSQCGHCRTLRKSRSTHVRCECGEKTHTKGACEGEHADNCCCSHGARCSCAHKKDHLEPVPESDSDASSTSVSALTSASTTKKAPRRPRAQTAQSENALTIFTNGQHKPGQKHNKAAHVSGLPYTLPRNHSVHGQPSAGLANRSVDNLPHTSTIDALHGDSQIKDSMVSAQQEQRMVKSEHSSPLINPNPSNVEILNGSLPPLDLSNMSSEYNYMQNMDEFSTMDTEQPMYSAALSAASIDWSLYDGLEFNSDEFATSSFSQPPSFTGFDFSSIDTQPALTATSLSGDASEMGDLVNIPDTGLGSMNNLKYESDFGTSDDGFVLSKASSYVGLPQGQMLVNEGMELASLDQFIKSNGSDFSNVESFSHGLAIYSDESGSGHVSPFGDDANFQFLNQEEEVFWNDFTGSGVSDNGCIPNTQNPWAQ